ncbi:Gldg family protein [Saccharicrinis fermentans]|uniref:ABC-type transport system n=1 Tax=Saccharicrinis fermentans DSM 9555 = JCM 21142 TaxID=869213 RepID=W7YS07_9BACT|nr:Gldg family protein [Saccharicrinis fermentans]GAF05204.1 ABC-type transport system [Saccharicrinis fermentans DSM 9555 = JCM 21142]
MKEILVIAKMELQKMFFSPIAWLVLIIFSVQSGFEIVDQMSSWVHRFSLGYGQSPVTAQLYGGGRGYFSGIQEWLFIFLPLVTMGLMSKEFSSGSIKLLYSSPISNKQIVLGKYLAAVVFSFAMSIVVLLAGLLGFAGIDFFDFGQVITGVLGLFLLMCAYSAIGLFVSSITSYQIVAAIGTIFLLFSLGKIGNLWQDVDFIRDITYWLSLNGRSRTFIDGLICTEDVLYFVFVSGLFITFSIFRLKGIREKSSRYISIGRYVSAFLVVALLGYVSTVPSMMKYYDSTRNNLNTLTKSSQEVMSKFEGKIKITTYANIYGLNFRSVSPRSQKRDQAFFEKYYRFYPNIELEYKYYYATPMYEKDYQRFIRANSGKTEQQILEKYCNVYNMDVDKIKPASAFKDEINLQAELNRCVRKIETEDGKIAFLHWYDDMTRNPSEAQITAALKGLVETLPMVGFVNGHGERDIDNMGTRGYFTVVKDKQFRESMLNNGIDFTSLNLQKTVPSYIDILIVAESKEHFSDMEMMHLNEYIDRGGNLVIAADIKRQAVMNPLVQQFDVKFNPGQVVEFNKGYTMDFVTSAPPNGSPNKRVVTMPGALSLSYDEKLGHEKSGFVYTQELVSDVIGNLPSASEVESLRGDYVEPEEPAGLSEDQKRMLEMLKGREAKPADRGKFHGSWNELDVTDFIDDFPMYNPVEGELGGALVTGLTLARNVEGKEQRILILGDADCFANGEISIRRTGIVSGNYDFISRMFYWLTHEESPVNVRRPLNLDDNMLLEKDEIGMYEFLYRLLIPAMFAMILLFIWLRRRGR